MEMDRRERKRDAAYKRTRAANGNPGKKGRPRRKANFRGSRPDNAVLTVNYNLILTASSPKFPYYSNRGVNAIYIYVHNSTLYVVAFI